MAFSSSFSVPNFSIKIDHPRQSFQGPWCHNRLQSRSTFAPTRLSSAATTPGREWSFLRGARVRIRLSNLTVDRRRSACVNASWLANTQIASSVFTMGTVAVLPFYALMILAPKSQLTIKSMESSIPYVVLGILYAYLLFLSSTPETIKLMFASKHWLPELPGMARMFSKEMTLASAWIHLLAVDLFAARQVFLDGLRNRIEIRHSVCLCLMFCPIGVMVHFLTKTFIGRASYGSCCTAARCLITHQVGLLIRSGVLTWKTRMG